MNDEWNLKLVGVCIVEGRALLFFIKFWKIRNCCVENFLNFMCIFFYTIWRLIRKFWWVVSQQLSYAYILHPSISAEIFCVSEKIIVRGAHSLKLDSRYLLNSHWMIYVLCTYMNGCGDKILYTKAKNNLIMKAKFSIDWRQLIKSSHLPTIHIFAISSSIIQIYWLGYTYG